MRQYLLSFSLCSILFLLTSCESDQLAGSGKIVSEERDVGNFTGISFSGTGTVAIKQSFKNALLIQTDENLIDHIKSEVSNGVLYIGPKDGLGIKKLVPSKSIYYQVTIRDLDILNSAGVGNVMTLEEIIGDKLLMDISGAGHLILEIEMDKLELSIEGASKVHLKGMAGEQIVKISGAAIYDGSNLKTKKATIEVSGVGDATVNVSEVLDVSISGAGGVKYKGSPEVKKQISGTGRITNIK